MERLRVALEKRNRKLKKLIATKVTKGAKERRLTAKKLVGQKKKLRSSWSKPEPAAINCRIQGKSKLITYSGS